MKHIKYTDINQFRNIIQDILRKATYVGKGEDGNSIYNPNAILPKMEFNGTIKLHGTNASVCYNNIDGIWYQSREHIITPEKDNAGFAFFAESNKAVFMDLFTEIANNSSINLNDCTISIYGEWAGKGIQKGVGISQIDKSFFIFGIKISNIVDETVPSYWIECKNYRKCECRIYNINDYKTYNITIDFNNPKAIQNQLIEYTNEVELECPVSKVFGISGVGEGIVWTAKDIDGAVYKFKVKGEKHSISKVKTLAAVDTEKLNSINEFIEYAVTENRFNQAIENIFGSDPVQTEKLGDVIKWIISDIIKEELDVMTKNNLEPKDICKYIPTKVKTMFFKLI